MEQEVEPALPGQEPWVLALSGADTEISELAKPFRENVLSVGLDPALVHVGENHLTVTARRASLVSLAHVYVTDCPSAGMALFPAD